VVVSIGPITTEALQGHGIQPDLHPEHPKVGHLLIAVAREAATSCGASETARVADPRGTESGSEG
jgi:uroporphyrinogen-III synthase